MREKCDLKLHTIFHRFLRNAQWIFCLLHAHGIFFRQKLKCLFLALENFPANGNALQ